MRVCKPWGFSPSILDLSSPHGSLLGIGRALTAIPSPDVLRSLATVKRFRLAGLLAEDDCQTRTQTLLYQRNLVTPKLVAKSTSSPP